MKVKITAQFIRELINGENEEFGSFPPEREVEIRDNGIAGFAIIAFESGVVSFIYRYRNVEGRARKLTIGKLGKVTATAAREVAKDMAADVTKGIDVHVEKKTTRAKAQREKQATIRGFIDNKYRDWFTTEAKTAKNILQKMETNFGEWYDLSMSDITSWKIMSWRSRRLKKGIAASTINREVAALRSMLAKAVRWGVIDKNPLSDLKLIKVDRSGVVRYLSGGEELRLKAALDRRQEQQRARRDRHNRRLNYRYLDPLPELSKLVFTDHLAPIILLALNTGMRRGEIFNLRLRDINLKLRQLTVQGTTSKSGQSRVIPLNDEATRTLTAWTNEQDLTDLVFPSPATGAPLESINAAWQTVLKDAGIENFRFHDLRHTFASKLVMRNIDLNTVRELLGHNNLNMTLRYAHLAPEHKAAAVAVLDTGAQSFD